MDKEFDEENEKVDAHYKLVSGIYSLLEFKLSADKDRCRYTSTANVLFFVNKKIDSLLGLILKGELTDSIYANMVLVRSVIDHFFLGWYIFTRFRIDRSDECARTFYVSSFMSEFIKRVYYDLRVDGIVKDIARNDSLENFNKEFGKKAMQGDIDETHQKAAQFDIRRIIKYLIHQTPKDDFLRNFHKSLSFMLHIYNETSNYVHGGAASEYEYFHMTTMQQKLNRMRRYISLCKLASWTLKEQLLSLIKQNNNEYIDVFIPIQMLIVEHQRQDSERS